MAQQYRITKAGTAIEQLGWAIKLLIEEQAYIPAITLAAAAEEVLGKSPGVSPAFVDLRDSLSLETGVPAKTVADDHLNRARNWFKHWGASDQDEMVLELETEAILYIVRGLTNARRGGHACLAEKQFKEWVAANRPDLG